MSDVPVDVKTRILENEIAVYKNTRYQLEIRHRVNKKLGTGGDQMKQIEKELENIEAALDELQKIMDELAEKPKGKSSPK